MGREISKYYTDRSAFEFVDSERALALNNSKGTKQGRLHLMAYNRNEGQDRYAVAAEKINFAQDSEAKLGWLDKKRFLLHKDGTTGVWYKINKNSLEKRLGIPSSAVAIDQTGVCSNLEVLTANKAAALKAWIDISNGKSPFEMQFLEGLVESGIPIGSYKKIVFFCPGLGISLAEAAGLTQEELDQETSADTILAFKDDFTVPSTVPIGGPVPAESWPKKNLPIKRRHINTVTIEQSLKKRILYGKPIPQKILDEIKNESLGLPSGTIKVDRGTDIVSFFAFGPETRLGDIRGFLDQEQHAHGAARRDVAVTVGTVTQGKSKIIQEETGNL